MKKSLILILSLALIISSFSALTAFAGLSESGVPQLVFKYSDQGSGVYEGKFLIRTNGNTGYIANYNFSIGYNNSIIDLVDKATKATPLKASTNPLTATHFTDSTPAAISGSWTVIAPKLVYAAAATTYILGGASDPSVSPIACANRYAMSGNTEIVIYTMYFKVIPGQTFTPTTFFGYVKGAPGTIQSSYNYFADSTTIASIAYRNANASTGVTVDSTALVVEAAAAPVLDPELVIDPTTSVTNTTASVVATASNVVDEECGIILAGQGINKKFLAYKDSNFVLFQNGLFAVVLSNIQSSALPVGSYTITPFVGTTTYNPYTVTRN